MGDTFGCLAGGVDAVEGNLSDGRTSPLCCPCFEGEPMSEVCRSFGISRMTGYKLMKRHREEGPVALCDRARRPVRYADRLPEQVERRIIAAKKEKPHWDSSAKVARRGLWRVLGCFLSCFDTVRRVGCGVYGWDCGAVCGFRARLALMVRRADRPGACCRRRRRRRGGPCSRPGSGSWRGAARKAA